MALYSAGVAIELIHYRLFSKSSLCFILRSIVYIHIYCECGLAIGNIEIDLKG